MARAPFETAPLWGVRKPSSTSNLLIDRGAPLGVGLPSVLLFYGPRLSDVASLARVLTRRGTVVVDRGPYGGQARSVITAATGTAFSPCLALNPTTDFVSSFTLSARVKFDGTAPTTGSFGSIGAALASDDTGRSPIFISPTSGSFRTRVPAETEFLAAGSNLLASSLSGWHRLTVTVSGSTATLYVDGGMTFVGTASQAMSNWNLRAVLGSDVTAGLQWNWPTADLFFWSRSLSADEVASHYQAPYSAIKDALADQFVPAVLPTTSVDTTNPWDDPFTPDFGPDIAPGVLAQFSGNAGLASDASSIIHSNFLTATAQFGGAAFLQTSAGVRKIAGPATFSGSASLSASGISTAPHFDGLGQGGLRGSALVRRSAVAAVAGSSGLSAMPGIRYSVRAAFQALGALQADAAQLLPFNRAQANLAGSTSMTATALVRNSPKTVLSGTGGLTVAAIIGSANSRAVLLGESRLIARASIRKAKAMRPGLAAEMIPAFTVIEIDTFIPGSVPLGSALGGHGTRPHGTLSRLPPSQIENTGMIRASDFGYRTAPTDANGPIPYPPLLGDAYQIDAAMTLEPSRTSASAAWGAVTLANPKRTFDGLIGVQNSDGRGVRLMTANKRWDYDRQYLTDPPYGSLASFFTGLATPWSLTDEGLQIPLRDVTYFLEKPLQQEFYGGSGLLDGTADLAGKPKPICRGGTIAAPIQNVTATLVDPTNRVYQYSDGPGQVVNLYEGAATGSGAIAYAGDTTNLYAGSTPFGQYRTDNSRGLFQLGSVPVNPITVDVIGLFSLAGAQTNPFDVCRYLIQEDMTLPPSMIDADSFTRASAATPGYVAGVYFGSDQAWSCVQAIDSMLQSLGANLVPTRSGQLSMLLLRDIADSEVVQDIYDQTEIINISRQALPTTLDPPPYRFRVGYSHNYTVQTTGINATLSTADRRQYVASSDRYSTFVNIGLLTAYRRPNDFDPLPGPLLVQANAQDVANKLGALWSSVPRRLYSVTLPRRFFGREMGDVVTLRYPIEQLLTGRKGRIVGYSLRATDAVVVYQVLV